MQATLASDVTTFGALLTSPALLARSAITILTASGRLVTYTIAARRAIQITIQTVEAPLAAFRALAVPVALSVKAIIRTAFARPDSIADAQGWKTSRVTSRGLAARLVAALWACVSGTSLVAAFAPPSGGAAGFTDATLLVACSIFAAIGALLVAVRSKPTIFAFVLAKPRILQAPFASASLGTSGLAFFSPPLGIAALNAIPVLFEATRDPRRLHYTLNFFASCRARLGTRTSPHVDRTLFSARSCGQEGFAVWSMDKILVEDTVWTIRRARLIALLAIEALLAFVANAAPCAFALYAVSTVRWTLLRAPKPMGAAFASLAFAMLVDDGICRVLRASISFACRWHVAVPSEITPKRTSFARTLQIATVAPLELIFALVALITFRPRPMATLANRIHGWFPALICGDQ